MLQTLRDLQHKPAAVLTRTLHVTTHGCSATFTDAFVKLGSAQPPRWPSHAGHLQGEVLVLYLGKRAMSFCRMPRMLMAMKIQPSMKMAAKAS